MRHFAFSSPPFRVRQSESASLRPQGVRQSESAFYPHPYFEEHNLILPPAEKGLPLFKYSHFSCVQLLKSMSGIQQNGNSFIIFKVFCELLRKFLLEVIVILSIPA